MFGSSWAAVHMVAPEEDLSTLELIVLVIPNFPILTSLY
jgi:hypothetical protein